MNNQVFKSYNNKSSNTNNIGNKKDSKTRLQPAAPYFPVQGLLLTSKREV